MASTQPNILNQYPIRLCEHMMVCKSKYYVVTTVSYVRHNIINIYIACIYKGLFYRPLVNRLQNRRTRINTSLFLGLNKYCLKSSAEYVLTQIYQYCISFRNYYFQKIIKFLQSADYYYLVPTNVAEHRTQNSNSRKNTQVFQIVDFLLLLWRAASLSDEAPLVPSRYSTIPPGIYLHGILTSTSFFFLWLAEVLCVEPFLTVASSGAVC